MSMEEDPVMLLREQLEIAVRIYRLQMHCETSGIVAGKWQELINDALAALSKTESLA